MIQGMYAYRDLQKYSVCEGYKNSKNLYCADDIYRDGV